MNGNTAKWPTVTKECPCPKCGNHNRCRLAPDAKAGYCWRGDRGEWHEGNGKARPSGYEGPNPASKPKPATSYAIAQEAIDGIGRTIAGKLAATWLYQNAADVDVLAVGRFNMLDRSKQFRPVHLAGDVWVVGDPDGQLPLYRLPHLAKPGPVYICEGEKATDAAVSIGLNATTSAHGAQSAAKSDWSDLAGRDCIIFPDRDDAGQKYAESVRDILHALEQSARVKIVHLPGLPDGGDMVEFLEARDAQEPADIKVEVERLAAEVSWLENNVRIEAVDACQLMHDFPELRPPVIHGFLREGETCNLISMPKVGKTHLGIDLALSVVTGRAWLSTFAVEAGRVLYIDCELHRNTFSNRLHLVAVARGILSDEFRGRLDILSLRGRLKDIDRLAPFFNRIQRGQYKIIILDALYRVLPPDCDENSNSDMAPVYNTVDRYAEQNGSAFIIVHHTSKGSQAGKSVTDVGAGASSAARATDSHVILREHEQPDCIVLEGACRSWPAPDPIVLRKAYPVWIPDDTLDPSDLKQPGPQRRKKKVEEEPDPVEPTTVWNATTFADAFVGPKPVEQATIIDLARQQGLTKCHAETCVRLGLVSGKIHRWKVRPSLAIFLANTPQPEANAL